MNKGKNQTTTIQKDSVRAVDRAIEILQVFTFEDPEHTLAQICAQTNLPKTTVFRILATLEQNNLIVQHPETGKYRLGYEIIKMGAIAQESNSLKRTAAAEMEEISRVTEQTCNLYVRDGFERLCIAQVMGAQYVRRYSYLGARHPLYCGAGKLLLAYAGKEFQSRFFESVKLERITEHTVTDRAQLERELEQIRRDGFSVTRGERDASTAMVSVPLFDYTQHVVASITVSGPVYYFEEQKVASYLEELQRAAGRISRKLCYLCSQPILIE